MCIIAPIKRIFKRRNPVFVLKSLVCAIITVMLILVLFTHSSEVRYLNTQKINALKTKISTSKSNLHRKMATQIQTSYDNMKFILLWTDPRASPFVYFGKGQSVFRSKSCRYTNCYVTGNRDFLGNYAFFHAVLFNGPQLPQIVVTDDLPRKRSPRQKYVYANIESAANYPLCGKEWNGFFNWTWTYRLDSDATWGYMVVKNSSNAVIGPKTNMHWISVDDMDDIEEELKAKLKSKQKAAAWLSSNCLTQSRREEYVAKIRIELRKFDLDVDVYGRCGDFQCTNEINKRCWQLFEQEYYFYFAFENSLSVDYVTEKIIYPLNHNIVPVVFGGANYTRFMPEGTYLDAYKLGPEKLAVTMNALMKNPQLYYEFFRWKKYYSFHFKHETSETDDYCKFCATLNDNTLLNKTSIHDNLEQWWNANNTCYMHRLSHLYNEFDSFYN